MTHIVYAHSGVSPYDEFFLDHFSKKYDVTFLSFNHNPKYVPDNIDVSIMPEPIGRLPALDGFRIYLLTPLRALMFKRFLVSLEPDVLIGCWAPTYGFYSALAGYRPFVLFVWGSDVLVEPYFLPIRSMVTHTLSKADAVIVDSEVQARACRELGCDSRKLRKFPWLDVQAILTLTEKGASEGQRLKHRLGLDGDPVVISTRWHEPIYNLESLIRAIPDVVKKFSNARFLILGRGSLTRELKNLAAELGVDDSVIFLGIVPRSVAILYLSLADVYVSSSLSDGTSASLLEAMTCKLSPVVTDVPGNREWVVDGRNGLLVPPKNPKSLAEAIIRLLESDSFRRRLGRRAHRTVLEKADWRKNSKILDDIMSSVTKC